MQAMMNYKAPQKLAIMHANCRLLFTHLTQPAAAITQGHEAPLLLRYVGCFG